MAKKTSFKAGTTARKARGTMAEHLKSQGASPESAFAIATAATKKMSPSGRKRMAKKSQEEF